MSTETKHPRLKVKTAFGIDIGGSGIKGAPVDLRTGEFLGDESHARRSLEQSMQRL